MRALAAHPHIHIATCDAAIHVTHGGSPMCSLNHAMLENVSMDCRGVVPLGVVLILALTSCAPPDPQTVWPEPRSLGKALTSSRPPPLLDAAPPARTVTNP